MHSYPFVLLFYGLALGFTLFLLGLTIRRAFRDSHRRDRILFVAALALGLWAVATLLMWALTLGRAWALAGIRPVPERMFPEGWPIYGFLAAYAVLGASSSVVLVKFPRRPTSSSDAQDELPSTAFARFRNAIVLSLPAIVGTGVFLAGVILSKLDDFSGAPSISWGKPGGLDRLRTAVLTAFYFACYFGAVFGPLLLPLAGQQAFTLTRTVGLRSTFAIWAWTFVVCGFVATAVFWGWLIHLDIFI